MKKKKILLFLGFSAIVVTILSGGIYFLTPTLPDLVEVPCGQLPSAQDVEKILAEHADTREDIESPSRGVWIGYDDRSFRCPGKADIVIYYDTLKTREKIKALIGETFFGIPYRMVNT